MTKETTYPILRKALAVFNNSQLGPNAKTLLLLNCVEAILEHIDGTKEVDEDRLCSQCH